MNIQMFALENSVLLQGAKVACHISILKPESYEFRNIFVPKVWGQSQNPSLRIQVL